VFPNEDGALSAGLFGRVRVPVSEPHDALLVTDRAVGTNQGQKYVFVVNEKNEVEYRAVDVGQVHDGLREVLRYRKITEPGKANGEDVTKEVEVLKPTDRVIVEGLQRVRPGATVKPQVVDMVTMLIEPAADNGIGSSPAAAGESKPAATASE
jgi:multidrug efflux pump subunit AcrA (membrane-fusion protein)